ncbi:hypothetical protein DY000_02002492 [Brassica cretica]|uniref:Uncharacterized protein n=1 Tax=Brassica cretica TaxID=69181 RepID=A0ABQ7CD92_BRACR|nr:hypothetical protein DY000_02002492 [Brassica cretica]
MYRRRTFLGQFRRSGFLGVFRRCLFVGTGVEPYNLRFRQLVSHPCLSAGVFASVWISQGVGLVVFWSKLRLEWTSLVVMAGPGLSQPCFACPPFGVAFGTVCGASDRSPVVNSNDRLSCYRFPVARSSCGLLILNGC